MQKKNWFVRIMVILLILFVTAIIFVSFVFSENRFVITAPIIFLVSILVVLSLAEIFDNFNIGNIVSLKKENKKVENELEITRQENKELRLHLTNVVTSISSNQNTTILGTIPGLSIQNLTMEKANKNEVEAEKKEQNEEASGNKSDKDDENSQQNQMKFKDRIKIISQIDNILISKYCNSCGFKPENILREMKFSNLFIDADPIATRNIIFDGYYMTQWQEEIFIEVIYGFSQFKIDEIYHMLSKIYHYRSSKKIRAKLVLLIPSVSDSVKRELKIADFKKDYFFKVFAPAINKCFLEIREIDISDEEIKK